MAIRSFTITRSAGILPITVLGLSLVLSGCGGGGGGGSADTASLVPTGVISTTADSSSSEAVLAVASSVNVSWTAPTQRANGDTLAMNELAGYRIYVGTNANPNAKVFEVNDPYTFDYTLQNLQPGTYQFSVTAIDTLGRESQHSNVLSRSVG